MVSKLGLGTAYGYGFTERKFKRCRGMAVGVRVWTVVGERSMTEL